MKDDSSRQKILAKLEKLISLSGSNNEHEANLAMETAIRIATEHSIELSQLSQSSGEKEESFLKEEASDEKSARLPITHKFISPLLQKYFQVNVVTSGNRAFGRKVWFIGKKENIDFAKFLNSYLENTFYKLWHEFYRVNPSQKKARETFFYGLYTGLDEKIESVKNSIVSNLSENIKTSYSLMILSDEEKMKNAVASFFPSQDGLTPLLCLSSPP
jgi:hypothetical protein